VCVCVRHDVLVCHSACAEPSFLSAKLTAQLLVLKRQYGYRLIGGRHDIDAAIASLEAIVGNDAVVVRVEIVDGFLCTFLGQRFF
jgi:hypothetical protein